MNACGLHELGTNAQHLTQTFNYLTAECRGAIATCPSKDLARRIHTTTQDLGKACMELVNLAGGVQNNASDKMLRQEFVTQVETVARYALEFMRAFETSARGAQACIGAEHAVSGIVADLNTVIMFATAGTLRSEAAEDAGGADSFGNHRESVLRSAKTLVEDTKALVSAAAAASVQQDELAQGVQTSVRTITKLADAVKLGAASLGCEQPDAQVLLVNAVKDVASALAELIG